MQQKHIAQDIMFINRELSALEFNMRVLKQAMQTSTPLLERLHFFFICCSNLDEFFEVRVASFKQQLALDEHYQLNDGLSAHEVLKEVSEKTHKLVHIIYETLYEQLIPALKAENIHVVNPEKWNHEQVEWVSHYFREEVMPIISPIAIDMSHPFPKLANKSLNFIVSVAGNDAFGRHGGLVIVHLPRSIPRVILYPNKDTGKKKVELFFLTNIIHKHIEELFPGMTVNGCYQFRITRNSDLVLEEDAIEDLASAVKLSLLARHYGTAVRLEIPQNCPDDIAQYLQKMHGLTEEETYRVNGPVNLSRYMMILKLLDRPDLHYPGFDPFISDEIIHKNNFFDMIREKDILLYHPYESFEPVLELIRQAKSDPEVLAIKQTLYRTGPDSPIILALVDAARAGKEVTVVVEVRARFDEESNLELANRLQEAGALVVYGVVGYKTHAKMLLIVRREGGHLQRYIHLGTGNYNAKTTREYTDISLFTYDPVMTQDVHQIFQQLTGMGTPVKTGKILHAPFTLFKTLEDLIKKEIAQAKLGKPAHIIAKMNALTDHKMIELLYEASRVGVKIDLIVRGMCCLRPKVAGLSENIRVISIVGRFLEHSRVFYFYHAGKERLYCSSADWMERNLHHRVEIAFPICDKKLASIVKKEALDIYLQDNQQSWELQANGGYVRNKPGKCAPLSAQEVLLAKYVE